MRHLVRITLALLTVAALAGPAQATPLVRLDFDNPFTADAGVFATFIYGSNETAAVGPWNASGWNGTYGATRFTGNPTSFSTLSLSGLAPHTMISASFILGFLESWDSLDGGCCAPDHMEIWIDGVQVGDMTYNNALGTVKDIDGGTLIAEYVQANGNGYYTDTLVNMATAPYLTFAHSASTLTIGFRASGIGWQGGDDEGWGVDDIRLDYDAVRNGQVPEPGSMLLLGTGLAAAFVRRRFRQQ